MDKTLLMLFFEYGRKACYHCSAGIGRSVALLLLERCYQIFKTSPDISFEAFLREYMGKIREIKELKPGIGEKYQIMTVPALAEQIFQLYLHLPREEKKVSSRFLEEEDKGVPSNQFWNSSQQPIDTGVSRFGFSPNHPDPANNNIPRPT